MGPELMDVVASIRVGQAPPRQCRVSELELDGIFVQDLYGVVQNERVEIELAVPGRPGVWALGDCAVVPDPKTGRPHPPTAQHALREARTVAFNISAHLNGRPARPFAFRTIGQLAAIGRRTGVARVFGINFSGFLAWWLWRTIYLSKLPRFEKKCRVAIDWTLDLIFAKDFVQFLTVRGPVMSTPIRDPQPAMPEEVIR